jgi:hypothetical protein
MPPGGAAGADIVTSYVGPRWTWYDEYAPGELISGPNAARFSVRHVAEIRRAVGVGITLRFA